MTYKAEIITNKTKMQYTTPDFVIVIIKNLGVTQIQVYKSLNWSF